MRACIFCFIILFSVHGPCLLILVGLALFFLDFYLQKDHRYFALYYLHFTQPLFFRFGQISEHGAQLIFILTQFRDY